MRRASPGDLVLSYAGAQIRHVGRVAEFAFSSPKPEEFGTIGSNWSRDGWLLPVYWTRLASPIRPKDSIDRLRQFLPVRYSPIRPATGDGNQGVYLAGIPPPLFDAIVSNAAFDRALLARGGSNSLS
jgi:hypothetical protein